MLTALQIGEDWVLLETRREVLASIGLDVITARGTQPGLDRIASSCFDCVILCHSLDPTERKKLAGEARRRHPRTPVLLVARGRRGWMSKSPDVDEIVDPDPVALLASVQHALQTAATAGSGSQGHREPLGEAG